MLKTLLTVLLLLLPVGLSAQEPPAREQYSGFVSNKRLVMPTSFHEMIYRTMEECYKRRGAYERVLWSIADSIILYVDGRERSAAAIWTPPGPDGRPEITIVKELFYDGETVSHEISHDLFGGDPTLDAANRCMLRWQNLIQIP